MTSDGKQVHPPTGDDLLMVCEIGFATQHGCSVNCLSVSLLGFEGPRIGFVAYNPYIYIYNPYISTNIRDITHEPGYNSPMNTKHDFQPHPRVASAHMAMENHHVLSEINQL